MAKMLQSWIGRAALTAATIAMAFFVGAIAVNLFGSVAAQSCRATDLGTLAADVSRAGELGTGDCETSVAAGRERWVDVYTFNLAEPAGVRITMTSDSGIDAYLILRDGDGTEIVRNDDGGGGLGIGAGIEIEELAAGPYRLEATNWNISGWDADRSYSYQLVISLLGQVVAPLAAGTQTGVASGYRQVSAGFSYTCAVVASGDLACSGADGQGQASPPAGHFRQVSAGSWHACAVAESGELACWGFNLRGQADAPTGRYHQVSANGFLSCAVSESGELACWGIDGRHGETDAPSGRYRQVSVGGSHTCAVTESDEVACWGDNALGQADAPAGRYRQVSAGLAHTCVVAESDEVKCWGDNAHGQADAPAGSYRQVSAGWFHTCAVAELGELACWGNGWDQDTELKSHFRSIAPTGQYRQVSARGQHTCVVAESGKAACWGFDESGSRRQAISVPEIGNQAADRIGACPDGMRETVDGCEAAEMRFTSPVADQRWQIGRRVSLTLPAVERSAGRVSYDLQHRFRDESFDRSLPPGLAFDSRSRQLSGTLSPGDVLGDSHRFQYTAVDEDGAEAVVEFGASIRLPDDFSWIGDAEVPDQDWTIGEPIERVQLPAARSAAGRVTYSMRWERQGVQSAGAPPGLSFNAGTRTLSGTPTGLSGPFTIFYRATEPTGVYRQIEIGADQEVASAAGGCEVSPLGTLRQGDVEEWADSAGGDCLWELDGERWRSDWYSFRLAERTRLVVEMRSLSRPNLVIRHADGRIIEGATAIRTTREARIALALDPGEYQIRAMQDAGSETYFRIRARFGARSSWGYSIKASLASPVEIAHFDLAMKYAPTLHFETDEKYFPVPVEMMIERSELKQKPNDITMQRQGSVSADDFGWVVGRETYLDLDDAKRADKGPPTIYANVHQFSSGTLLQYWFFYLYNETETITKAFGSVAALITQALGNHEGDWESFQLYFADQSITDLLSGDVAPDEVGFASHEQGFAGVQLFAPGGAAGAACGKFDVYIANGRHASYPEDGKGTTGFFDWDLFALPEISGRPNADGGFDKGDKYQGGRTWGVPGTGSDDTYEIRMLSPNEPPWLRWEGNWGGLDEGESGAPKGPVTKPHWALTPSRLVQEAGWLPLQFDCAMPKNWNDYRSQFTAGR